MTIEQWIEETIVKALRITIEIDKLESKFLVCRTVDEQADYTINVISKRAHNNGRLEILLELRDFIEENRDNDKSSN